MKLSVGPSGRVSAAAGIKLARLLELPEKGAEDRLRALEALPLFKKLSATGVLRLEADKGARFAARKAAGMALRQDAGIAVDEDLAGLIEDVGQDSFTALFLRDEEGLADAERARRCGITERQAAALRALVDRLYIQEELEGRAAQAPEPAPPVCGAVAGVGVEGGKPCLAFFHRDLWRGRYAVDPRKREQLASALPAKERRAMDALLLELEQLERRKSTLLKVLETILEVQAAFLVSGDRTKIRPLTQRALAERVDSDPSVVNRLMAGKSIELPWGLEAPLRSFAPSPKAVLREKLRGLLEETPGAPAEALRAAIEKRFGAKLSRRSVAQYLLELRESDGYA